MISFNKKYETYSVYINSKYFVSYSKHKHGKFAKLLAEKSDMTHKKYYNYYDEDTKNNCSLLYIVSKIYGIVIIRIRNEDVDNISDRSWYVMKHADESMYIASSSGLLGRILLKLKDPNKVVTFKDNDYLNYRLDNLIATPRTERYSQDVLKIYNDENLVWKNVREHNTGYIHRFRVVYFSTESERHIRKCKDIYFNTDDYDIKKDMAIQLSIQKRFENGYTLSEEDFAYVKEHDIKLK